MNVVESAARRVDALQQRHVVTAFPFAVVKKFGDDQAGALAALVAYYGFFAMFPLLLVFVTILGLVLSGQPELRESIVTSALGRFPVIGEQIRSRADVEALSGNWLTLVFASATSLWAGLGVAQAAQKAMNVVWDIPRSEWPSFVERRLRSLLMLVILGSMIVASTLISGLSASGFLVSAIANGAAYVVPVLLNLVLFTVAFQVLTARDLRWPKVLPGAIVAAVAWSALQRFGGHYVTHEISQASDVYGAFALVIGLLVWIALGAQLLLMCAEINVVANRHLWPRSLVQPPLNDGDRKVYRAIAHRGRMRPEVSLRVWFTDDHDKGPNDGEIGRSGPHLGAKQRGAGRKSD